MSTQDAKASALRRVFSGPVHLPGSAGYREQVPSLAIENPKPILVAEAARADDVRAAIVWARDNGIPFAVQSTGHGTVVPSDGGLLLKTGALARVLIDPDRAVATVGAGVRWGTVVDAAAPLGLVPLCGTSTDVGVAGYTMGGGFGWLARRFGLAADSVVRATLVTAAGEQLTVTPDVHPDLFWAIRGGGGNFGVVTSLDFRLYPVRTVVAGTAVYPFDRAADVLAAYAAWDMPRELSATVVLARSAQGPRLAVHCVYAGDAGSARAALAPARKLAGAAQRASFTAMRFSQVNLPSLYPSNYELVAELTAPVVTALVDTVTDRVAEPADALEVRRWGGAIADAGPGAGPAGHRDVPFAVTVEGSHASAEPLRRHATGGTFLNFTRNAARTSAAYTSANYQRLQEVKSVHDPENFFHRNYNVPPPNTGAPANSGRR